MLTLSASSFCFPIKMDGELVQGFHESEERSSEQEQTIDESSYNFDSTSSISKFNIGANVFNFPLF